MKKSILILAAVVISLIGVKAQQNLSKEKGQIVILEKSSEDVYESLVKDFESWYINNTTEEMTEDEENLELYNELFDSFELTNQIKKEETEDEEYDKLYSSIKEDLEMYEVLSIAEINF